MMYVTTCLCAEPHSPVPLAFQVHHVLPKSWGGPDVKTNKVTICGTCHDNVHHALDRAVAIAYATGGIGTLTATQVDELIKPYSLYEQSLIRRAINGAQANGRKLPKIYT
jgi:5-methylcytosine-specific restriction endonuclease McrA